jgi:transposase InsO family protein
MTSASSIVAGVAGGRQARSVADHTPFDIWVYEEHQRAVRPWLTVILDDYSRAVASFGLRLQTPSSQQTALALRKASWRKGDPRQSRWPDPPIYPGPLVVSRATLI